MLIAIGSGPGRNWRLRTTRAALAELGFRNNLLRHGIQREVFIAFLASGGWISSEREGVNRTYRLFALPPKSVDWRGTAGLSHVPRGCLIIATGNMRT